MEAIELKKPPGIMSPYLPICVLGSEIRDTLLAFSPLSAPKLLRAELFGENLLSTGQVTMYGKDEV